jgi:hypothetical protein
MEKLPSQFNFRHLRVVLSFIVVAVLFASCKENEKPEAIKSKYDCDMVVLAHAEASRVGTEIMNQGGNAIDAAIATHFALAVTYPVAGNLGGGGFAVIRTAEGENLSLDFREVELHLSDAWMDHDIDKVDYEINFTKYFYQFKRLRSVVALTKDLLELDKESEQLLGKIIA